MDLVRQFGLLFCSVAGTSSFLLSCSDRGRSVLTFLHPVGWKNVVFVKAYSRRLRIISGSRALADAPMQNT